MPEKKMDVLDCLQSIADSLQKAVALLERIADKVAPAGSEKKTAGK
ncbi:MAG: hypothetical protein PHE88_12405 [Elusimicrobia bacterium]|nr:hypothetical protein [Elusimicrobiota bacterium]